jgi:hypothetical protein
MGPTKLRMIMSKCNGLSGQADSYVRFFTRCNFTAEEDKRRNEKQNREASSFFISVGKAGLPPALHESIASFVSQLYSRAKTGK